MRTRLSAIAALALIPVGVLHADPIFMSATRGISASGAAPYSSTDLMFWTQSTSGTTTEQGGGGPTTCNAAAGQNSTIGATSVDFAATLTVSPYSQTYHTCNFVQSGASLIANFTLSQPTAYTFTTAVIPSFDPNPSSIREPLTNGVVRNFATVADRTGTLPAGSYVLRISKVASSSINPMTNSYQETLTFAVTGLCCRGATCGAGLTEANCVGAGNAGSKFISDSQACNSAGISTTPCCYADYDKVNGVAVQDIFAYLNDWFAGSSYAVIGSDGQSGTLTVQHIFNFLNAWFVGCS